MTSRRGQAGPRSLADCSPAIASEWHPTLNGEMSPNSVLRMSGKSAWWVCSRGHEWEATVCNRVGQGSGCPFCSGRRAIPGETDIGTTHLVVALVWHPTRNPVSLTTVLPTSRTTYWWQCGRGHEWEASVVLVTQSSGLCPYCTGARILPGFNDLFTKHPEIAGELHPLLNPGVDALSLNPMGTDRCWWQCERGHEWEAEVRKRVQGTGCPYCRNGRLLRGYNDLATLNPRLASELDWATHGPDAASSVTAWSGKSMWWRCDACDDTWESTVGNRSRGQGCPSCAISGFKDALPGVLYLYRTSYGSLVFGISNDVVKRFRSAGYKRRGHEKVMLFASEQGRLVRAAETLVRRVAASQSLQYLNSPFLGEMTESLIDCDASVRVFVEAAISLGLIRADVDYGG